MCTLIIATRLVSSVPLFGIHNRDEKLSRASTAPGRWVRNGQEILAPRDEKAGGSWVALNQSGVFAGITNRYQSPSLEHHRSRGELVLLATEEENAQEGMKRILALSGALYPGFHLFIADQEKAYVIVNLESELYCFELPPGLYVLTERSFQRGHSHRLDWLSTELLAFQDRFREEKRFGKSERRELGEWMTRTLESNPLEGTCIQIPGVDYGTRCSTWVELGEGARRLLFAPGPPCSTPYEEYTTPRAWAF